MGEIEELLKGHLKPARYLHTLGVVKTAEKLAKRHRVAVARCRTAALLHDCAKTLERESIQHLLKRSGADALECQAPGLWHAPVGAWLARRTFGVKDPEILAAIRNHSTGAPGMTPLQKILFVADYIEPGRPKWPELKTLRPLAMRDLDRAFFEVLRHKLMDLLQNGRKIHPRSLAAYHEALP